MKAIHLAFLLGLASPVSGLDSATWLRENMAAIESTINMPPEEAIEILGKRLSIGFTNGMLPEQEIVFKRAQGLLVKIPEHAEFYRQRMSRILDATEAESDPDRKAILYHHDSEAAEVLGMTLPDCSYDQASTGLRNLRFLQTPEAVSTLGSFLRHPEGRNGRNAGGQPWPSPGSPQGVSITATLTLREIGIDNPPTRTLGNEESAWVLVDAWAEWWEEVKSGKRTYRFEGSPIEYGPDGPVDPSTLKHRDRRQPAASTSPLPKSSPPEAGLTSPASESKPSRTFLAITLAAIALLLTGAYRAFLRRKTTPTR